MSQGLPFGLVQVYFGKGKGKTTAAAGLCLRALHHGFPVLFFQFLKTKDWPSGEIGALSGFRRFRHFYAKYTHPLFYSGIRSPSAAQVRADQKNLAKRAAGLVRNTEGVVVLDEILNALSSGFLGRKEVLTLLAVRPKKTEMILTGRELPAWLKTKAKLITEFREIRHPFRGGLAGRKGIEF